MMMMSAPAPLWTAAVTRAWMSFWLIRSTRISAPACFPNSRAWASKRVSAAGMKWDHWRRCSVVPCAWAGARPAARIPAIPAPFEELPAGRSAAAHPLSSLTRGAAATLGATAYPLPSMGRPRGARGRALRRAHRRATASRAKAATASRRSGAQQDVVVVGAGHPVKPLRTWRRREEPSPSSKGTISSWSPWATNSGRVRRADPAPRVEAVPRERAQRAVVPARHVGQAGEASRPPRPRRRAGARPGRSTPPRRATRRSRQCAPGPSRGRSRGRRRRGRRDTRRPRWAAGAAPVSPVVVGEHAQAAARRGRVRTTRAPADIPRIAV